MLSCCPFPFKNNKLHKAQHNSQKSCCVLLSCFSPSCAMAHQRSSHTIALLKETLYTILREPTGDVRHTPFHNHGHTSTNIHRNQNHLYVAIPPMANKYHSVSKGNISVFHRRHGEAVHFFRMMGSGYNNISSVCFFFWGGGV